MGTRFRCRKANSGFTLVEMGIVLVIAGIMMTLGYYSWGLVVEGRKNAATQMALNRAKACIMSSIVADNTYPTWTATRTAPISPADAVDRCLDGRTDTYGNPIYFIEGVRSSTQGGGSLAGNCILPDSTRANNDPCSPNYTTTPPGPPPIVPQTGTTDNVSSYAVDREGTTVTDVAFILASFGRSGVADNLTLRNLFPTGSGTLSARMLTVGNQTSFARREVDGLDPLAQPTDVGTWGNDMYVIVTYQEIVGEIARARGLTGHSGL